MSKKPIEIKKDNSGVQFTNDYKTEDKHPDFRGQILIEGKRWNISTWVNTKTRHDGSEYQYMSHVLEPFEEQAGGTATESATPTAATPIR